MADYYALIDVRIDDAEAYGRYMALARPIIEKNGGTYLVRGGEHTVVEGDYFSPRRLVLLRFPSRQAFESFHTSDEYRQARAIRQPAADMVMVGVEGYDG
ncbi:MAG: DUF1330 domain-containing protein [Alphaproteobacteria bacterium]